MMPMPMLSAALLLLMSAPMAAMAARPVAASVLRVQEADEIDAEDAGVFWAQTDLEGPHKPPKKFHFKAPRGIFIQERASKQLPGPGQHFSFGALVPWEQIHAMLNDDTTDSKLLLLVRHGQAISNWLDDTLGPDDWFQMEGQCAYTDSNGTTYDIFDADLTDMGRNEAKSLNGMLDNSGWFKKLNGGRPTRAIVSPLSRCLHTAELVLAGLPVSKVEIEENIRETLGEDTCDARRSVSSPKSAQGSGRLEGPCDFDEGLQARFSKWRFPIVNETLRQEVRGSVSRRQHRGSEKPEGLGFGLISDSDTMWTEEREGQKHQVTRAVRFLMDVFDLVEEKVVVVVTHSGTVRSILLAAGREPYRPQNTELVPLVVQEIKPEPYL